MNVLSTKLSLIEWLLSLQDQRILNRLELFKIVSNLTNEEGGQPLSLKAFYRKIELSEKALDKGKTIPQPDLRKEIKTWSKK